MIIVIKNQDYKRLAIKTISFLSLIVMFFFYYQHMANKFKEQNAQLVSKLEVKKTNQEKNKQTEFEKTIYGEAVNIVDLINQKHVQSIKIVKDRLMIVCDYDTDIEPIMIRFGVKAFVKNTTENIKIAIDLKTIVENRYEI